MLQISIFGYSKGILKNAHVLRAENIILEANKKKNGNENREPISTLG